MTSLDGTGETSLTAAISGRTRRPRASTSPWLPSLFGGDHQSWFNDPRFDGSFSSRVLPFLYLGNLAHASNVYMLQALGITHVVSVGECALVPPDSHNARGRDSPHLNHIQGSNHFIPSKSSSHQGSLWIEERAGRIKVLDIQGVCDDGIDTLEPQLEPICDWIDQARQEGGQVLVHCRVGVSRSATVTIAYVMKHLSLPLVDAYLIVRSRRLSVLIQPNMRLLYNCTTAFSCSTLTLMKSGVRFLISSSNCVPKEKSATPRSTA
ncbi:protein-tyrosine phosphatase-like protein [Lentinula raphanica]|nr:protein-tyrosine phosphatase-like protein [Lentinula raphanica]